VGFDVTENATAAMHEQDGCVGRAARIGGDVFAHLHPPRRTRHGEVACLSNFRRHDLRLGQRATILVARGGGGETPQRRDSR
jgi:hypothetical protein